MIAASYMPTKVQSMIANVHVLIASLHEHVLLSHTIAIYAVAYNEISIAVLLHVITIAAMHACMKSQYSDRSAREHCIKISLSVHLYKYLQLFKKQSISVNGNT